MLFNEPKLLKYRDDLRAYLAWCGFSALQRAEIAEKQRVEPDCEQRKRFSALQRAEIAESTARRAAAADRGVSVLFNEPKLLKSGWATLKRANFDRFSALQRAEIAEIAPSV